MKYNKSEQLMFTLHINIYDIISVLCDLLYMKLVSIPIVHPYIVNKTLTFMHFEDGALNLIFPPQIEDLVKKNFF